MAEPGLSDEEWLKEFAGVPCRRCGKEVYQLFEGCCLPCQQYMLPHSAWMPGRRGRFQSCPYNAAPQRVDAGGVLCHVQLGSYPLHSSTSGVTIGVLRYVRPR